MHSSCADGIMLCALAHPAQLRMMHAPTSPSSHPPPPLPASGACGQIGRELVAFLRSK